MRFVSAALLISTSTLLAACGATGASYQPIVDGHVTSQYRADLSACQGLAEQRRYLNDDVKTSALGGAVVGGLLGAVAGVGDGHDGDIGGVVAGAALGAAVSGGQRAWKTKDERKGIVVKCMTGRGHRVVG